MTHYNRSASYLLLRIFRLVRICFSICNDLGFLDLLTLSFALWFTDSVLGFCSVLEKRNLNQLQQLTWGLPSEFKTGSLSPLVLPFDVTGFESTPESENVLDLPKLCFTLVVADFSR
mmetsp:Transcript_13355/g.16194  ORF Transcript_13355/g.16194 Transcript_13355/m.16194 type:complete len:117 (-) Transcript_13355:563-913(-)